jgi:hypothetical protein
MTPRIALIAQVMQRGPEYALPGEPIGRVRLVRA